MSWNGVLQRLEKKSLDEGDYTPDVRPIITVYLPPPITWPNLGPVAC